MFDTREYEYVYDRQDYLTKSVNIPIELYESAKGNYFIGYADGLQFGNETSAWARLYNPCDSGVNLHVNVWTVTDLSPSPFRAQFWFNATAPGTPIDSPFVTPSNTALCPLPQPKIKLQSASNVTDEPSGGVNAFVRSGEAGITLVETENGKLIFPPGGSFLVYLSLSEDAPLPASGRIAFGWWEERIPTYPCPYYPCGYPVR